MHGSIHHGGDELTKINAVVWRIRASSLLRLIMHRFSGTVQMWNSCCCLFDSFISTGRGKGAEQSHQAAELGAE